MFDREIQKTPYQVWTPVDPLPGASSMKGSQVAPFGDAVCEPTMNPHSVAADRPVSGQPSVACRRVAEG
jgi:hypothetical protein